MSLSLFSFCFQYFSCLWTFLSSWLPTTPPFSTHFIPPPIIPLLRRHTDVEIRTLSLLFAAEVLIRNILVVPLWISDKVSWKMRFLRGNWQLVCGRCGLLSSRVIAAMLWMMDGFDLQCLRYVFTSMWYFSLSLIPTIVVNWSWCYIVRHDTSNRSFQ